MRYIVDNQLFKLNNLQHMLAGAFFIFVALMYMVLKDNADKDH